MLSWVLRVLLGVTLGGRSLGRLACRRRQRVVVGLIAADLGHLLVQRPVLRGCHPGIPRAGCRASPAEMALPDLALAAQELEEYLGVINNMINSNTRNIKFK